METQSLNVVVSELTLDDIEWFVEVAAVNMLTHEVQRPELINVDNLYKLASMGLQSGTAFIAKKGDVPVGALGSLILPNLFNPDLTTMAEIFWYVLPEYRNTRAGALLFNAFDKKAEELGADEATLSLLGSSIINVNTLAKRQFHLGEYAFRKQYGGL